VQQWRSEQKTVEEPQPAYKVKKLTSDEVRGLRRAGLTEDQIEAVSLVGMGADEVNELMLRGFRGGRFSDSERGSR
jgi:hypothetical protein